MTKYVLIHGIRKKTLSPPHMEGLRRALTSLGASVRSVHYGYILIPISNKRSVRKALEAIQPYIDNNDEIVLIGYSNGAWTAVQIAELGYKIDRLVLISPALHSSHAFPEQVKYIDVFWCPTDKPTRWAKIWRGVTRFIPLYWRQPHGWGAMGANGYLGKDERVRNHRMPDYVGHSFFLYPEVIDKVVHEIICRRGVL